MAVIEKFPAAIIPHPTAPITADEAGLSLDLLTQLVLKTLYFSGELSGAEISQRLGLRFSVIEPVLELLRQHRHCEILRGSMLGASSYEYLITDAGRERAALFLENNHYVGVAPVPLEQYRAYLQAFAKAMPRTATRERVRQAFGHLVLSDRVLDQLGPAVNSGHSLFVYGPPGNGKTVISQALRNLLDGEIAVPHALEVEGAIIRVFDPVNHDPIAWPPPGESLDLGTVPDQRWVRCRRPLITVGGELTLEALDLNFSPINGFYKAPVQMLATGGVLVIDDFGRQQVAPRDLLNRWIVPLETRVDYLTLKTGTKFELPFLAMVAFATNIKPGDLVDEAFLRRIHYKVFAESPTRADFLHIFRNCCRAEDLAYDERMVSELLDGYFVPRRIGLRGCHPRDLIGHALSLADYLGEPRRLTLDLLLKGCAGYFVDDSEGQATIN